MDLESIMLRELSQGKTNTLCYHLYVESKKKQTNIYNKTEIEIQRINLCLSMGNRKGEGQDRVGETENTEYKINEQ